MTIFLCTKYWYGFILIEQAIAVEIGTKALVFFLDWPLIGGDIFDFFSETSDQNSTKLDRKQDLNVLYQVFVFQADWKKQNGRPGGLLVCSTFFCPSHFSFPDVYMSSFEILIWILVYEFFITWHKSSLSFVRLDLLFWELLPFATIEFSRLFSAVFWDIDLKIGIWIYNIIQIKFEFCHAWPSLTWVIVLCWNLVFLTFTVHSSVWLVASYWIVLRIVILNFDPIDLQNT